MSRGMNIMSQVPESRVPRNMFDLSHSVLTTGKFGKLYPVLCQETLPGDSFRDTMSAMVRFAPMLAPVYAMFDVKTDFFFVPYRLLFDQWEDFITGGQDGNLAPVLPFITPQGVANLGLALPVPAANTYMLERTLWDHLGLPTTGLQGPDPADDEWSNEQILAFPFTACTKIFNDWFRDPNLDDEVVINTSMQGDVSAISEDHLVLRDRGWSRDYFTGALPFAQRGAQVMMPLSGIGTPVYSEFTTATTNDGVTEAPIGDVQIGFGGFVNSSGGPVPPTSLQIYNITQVDIDNATTSINDLRLALAMQSWLEKNARGGARYNEQIKSHFNRNVPDYRLQRSEYLGGGRQPVQISQVLSTADTADVPVGDMAGHGISFGKTNRFKYTCDEHGVIIGFLSVVPKSGYVGQGIRKMFSRKTKFDFAWPEFAHLGEQEVKSMELFFSFDEADDADNHETFGYVPRYAEYKIMQDSGHGDFRGSLYFWHELRIFRNRPSLDGTFVTVYDDSLDVNEQSLQRIFAVQDGTDYLWMSLHHKLTVMRPLPYFGVPKLIG